MNSEISYLPIDVSKKKAIVIGPELREENPKLFSIIREQYMECFKDMQLRFGKRELALKSLCEGIDFENLTGSNFLFANYLASFSSKQMINLSELEGILNQNSNFFSKFYTDLSEVILLSNKSSYPKNKYLLEHLVNQLEYCGYEFNPERPLIIPSPRIVLDSENFDKGYGLLLELDKDAYYDSSFIPHRESILLGGVENILSSSKNGINRISFIENELNIGPNLNESYENGRIVFIEK